jgi:hypothetical protein
MSRGIGAKMFRTTPFLWKEELTEEDAGQHPEHIPGIAVVGRKPRW